MNTQYGTLHTLARHLVSALEPLKEAVADLPAFRTVIYRLGWDVKSLPPEYASLGAKVDSAITALNNLGESPQPSQIFAVLGEVTTLYQAFKGITSAPEGVDAAAFSSEIGRRLFELLLMDYLSEALPLTYSALLTIGIITEENVDETEVRPGFLLRRFQWDEIPKVVTDPASIPARVYGWGTDDLDFHRLTGHLLGIFLALDLPAYIGRVDEKLGSGFQDLPDYFSPSIEWGLKIPVLLDNIGGKEIEVGLALMELPAQNGKPAGLILQPLASPQIGESIDITDHLRLELRAGSDVSKTFGVLLRPGDLSVKFPFQQGAVLPDSGFGATLRYAPESPALLLGMPGKSRLELKDLATIINLDSHDGRLELGLEIAPGDMKLIIAAADLDGFLGELLGNQDMTASLPIIFRWSSETGIGFVGGMGFRVSLPGNLRWGPTNLQQIQLALTSINTPGQSPELALGVGTSLSGRIGPVAMSLDNVGLRMVFRFADGNAGPFDLDLGFQPPLGVGLSIDAQGVLTGGGFLFHDPARQLYAGAMQLSLHDEITLNAFGLIATRLPDGRPGYSMLIFITADGFKPVPLGFGFVLQSIGGMVGINRTFDHEVLRAGLKTDMLRTLLFPRDPVANAPALIQALSAAFPAKPGSYLLGLMARITWFTPPLVQMDLALIRELGARERLLVLGRASALLPSADNDLIRLNMDALGVLDFDAGTLEADAVLVDSRLVHKFPITGSAALRARWPAGGGGLAGSHFVLAVGGLNPRFAAPAGFPTLDRVAIALSSGENPRLICDAYFAITPNTVQFGARASLYAKGAGFTVTGDLGFDALVTIVPPHFIVDFHALVQLKYKSRNLFKVALDGTLEGPLPLRIAAKAKFKILWFSFTVRFAFTLADGSASRSIAAISLETELEKALTDPANWSTRRAPGVVHGVALRSLPANAGLVLDPLGQLVVQQQVVPLNTHRDIDTYGGAPIAGRRRFTAAASLNGKAGTPVTGAFAPARYFTMSDDEKLAAPSFEEMDAGFVVGDTDATFDENAVAASGLNYEPITVNPSSAAETAGIAASFAALPATQLYTMPLAAFQAQRSSGAAARAPVRHVGRARFRNTAVTPAATLSAPRWRIIRASDGAPAPLDPGVNSWSDCRAALADLNRGGVRWLMVPAHELEAL